MIETRDYDGHCAGFGMATFNFFVPCDNRVRPLSTKRLIAVLEVPRKRTAIGDQVLSEAPSSAGRTSLPRARRSIGHGVLENRPSELKRNSSVQHRRGPKVSKVLT